MRYGLKRHSDGSLIEGFGWNKKSHAEYFIQQYLKDYGGLDSRVGGLFKAKGLTETLEIVHTKTKESVVWLDVEPEKPY